MKALTLLALAALATLPLSAHDAWREPRRVVVMEAPRCAPYPRWEARHRQDRWDDHWERRGWYRRQDWSDRDDRVLLQSLPRPLGPPFGGRVELRFR
jgi:hypothetical protein